LARKYGLFATEEPHIAHQDLVEQVLQDLKLEFVRLVISSDSFEASKNQWIEDTMKPQLELLSKYLSDKDWFIGELNYVDFIAYETLDWLRLFDSQTFGKFDNLERFLKRFENLPAISNYIHSSEFKQYPIFGPMAKWGYRK
jgi:glutathione S-transferase